MNEYVIKNISKNYNTRLHGNITQIFINGTWHNRNEIKNFSLQKRYRNYNQKR